MIHISELLNLTLFDDFKIIAGEKGLNNEMSNIVILEYESFKNTYEVFNPYDFVLSSLFFAKDNPSLIEDALLNLMKRKVSGIAIKTVFFNDIPEKVKHMANKLNIPIFLFSNAFMEDLIISANELLKSKLQYLVYEEKITKLLDTKISTNEVSAIADLINPAFYKNIITSYFTPKDSIASNAVSFYFERLLYNRYKSENYKTYSYIKYRHGIFLIYSFEDYPTDLKNTVLELLKSINLPLDHFNIGISDTLYAKSNFHFSMKESIYSNRIAQLEDTLCKCYSELGIYKFIMPLLDDPIVLKNYNNQIKSIKEYDKKYTSNLLETLITHVNCNGEISKTASKLFQHPNTIRYRLKKACTILNCHEKGFYSYVNIMIYLYLIETNTKL